MTQLPLTPDFTRPSEPVECLGMTFASDEERRAYFTERLREKLSDPEFRKIEGFPIGSDENILALSDPPYYTACPNPFIADFVRVYGLPYDPNEPYSKEPFAADVSEGKNDPIYNAHSYHTKVPHKAILRYILHYTKPGDIVLDGFCGTGMTGVAAQLCGYPDREFKTKIEQEWEDRGWGKPAWGVRRSILGDLSPAATFIAYNYNTPMDVVIFERDAKRILVEIETEYSWMYETSHTDGRKGRVNYTVWSDVFVCPECANEIVFWDVAVDQSADKVRENFACPQCLTHLTKRTMERAWVSRYDPALKQVIRQIKQVPVRISYTVGKKRFEKAPDLSDIDLINRIEDFEVAYWYPTDRMPEGDEARRNDGIGITHVHHFYTKRDLIVISAAIEKSKGSSINALLMLSITSLLTYASKLSRWRLENKSGPLSGTLYVSSTIMPLDALTVLPNRHRRLAEGKRSLAGQTPSSTIIYSQSSTNISAKDDSLDYIFTDPPFGANIWYSDLNFIWEAWLKVQTNNEKEAVESKAQGKRLLDYQHIMEACFREYYRVLKPGRWMTVVFSNTKAAVWNAIQTALEQSGFIVANVAALDKQQYSFKAVTTPTAVKQDLVISCYKPDGGFEERFKQERGSELGAWDFIQSHLQYLPIFLSKGNQAVEVVERTARILYDRLVAYFVQHGYPVPLSAQEFQTGLMQRFPVRDGMYFLPEQVAEYERKRMTVREVQQLEIFVTGESSAIQWVHQQLLNKPQTISDLTPSFLRELNAWPKHEKLPELRMLLDENFLPYEGDEPIPPQIVAWMRKSADLRDLISSELAQGTATEENGGLKTTNSRLISAARDRWYVPDPNRAIDVEKRRLKGLLREFETYLNGRGKLKQFRTEAVKAGFKQAWNTRSYEAIVQVAERLPEAVLQEDNALLMYYDNANLLVG